MNKNAEYLKLIRDKVGVQTFKEVAKLFEGSTAPVVFNNFACQGYVSKEERDAALLNDFYRNMSLADIADKYALGIDAIYKITSSTQRNS